MKTSGKNNINIKLISAVVLLGTVCGITGAAFHWCIAYITELRRENPLIFFLLPFAGLASVFIYKKLKVTRVGTMDVLESINFDKPLPARVAAAVFGSSVITHLFGASCGKEGAALPQALPSAYQKPSGLTAKAEKCSPFAVCQLYSQRFSAHPLLRRFSPLR